jgi:single-stranded-DNA-specific exonuclease
MERESGKIAERPFDGETAAALEAAGLPRLTAKLLAQRGIGPDGAEAYFSPCAQGFPDPRALPGAEAAAKAVLAAARAAKRIVVFGDYDCDGVCATAIMLSAIAAVQPPGAPEPSPFLPRRLDEGYGMTDASVARMLADNPGVALVVTVDNGVNSVREIAALKERGIETVVTDHHLPGEEKPSCAALVNPVLDGTPAEYGCLCGAGVAFLIAHLMVETAKKEGFYAGPKIAGPMLVLAGIATVTDIMPLKGVNRFLVAKALDCFKRHAPVGIRELFSRASRTGVQKLTARDFGFLIGPRMNAAGRMADAVEALELATTSDKEIARECARIVDLRNSERKNAETAMCEEAFSKIVPGAPAQVVCLSSGHPGVAGIVAARTLEKMSSMSDAKPVPVCVVVDGRGSARAPAGYNVRDAFAESAEALDRFGGHAAAGGVSVKDGMDGRFAELFGAACARQAASGGFPPAGAVTVDSWVAPDDLTLEFVASLSRMEPFGEGNPEPVFALRGARLRDVRPIGAEGRHLQFCIEGWDGARAVWWGGGPEIERLRAKGPAGLDLVFTAAVSDYGAPHVELRIASAV